MMAQRPPDILEFLDGTVEILAGKVSDNTMTRANADLRLEQLMSHDELEPSSREFVRGYFEGRIRTLTSGVTSV